MALCPGDAAAAPGARAVRGAAAAAVVVAAAPGARAARGAGAAIGAAASDAAGTGAAETEAIGEVEKDPKEVIGGAKEETGEKPGRG